MMVIENPVVSATTTDASTAKTDPNTGLNYTITKIPVTDPIQTQKDVNALIDLGSHKKAEGDYAGAVEAWVKASKLSPTDYVSLANLGNIYAYYIRDNFKAVDYYTQAIAKGKTVVYLYVQFAEVYLEVIQDKAKALDIVNQGLVNIPNDPTLLQFKESLK
jgi:tetratricopeptide (TPR) repeat protein